MHPPLLGILQVKRRQCLGIEQCHARVVAADDRITLHFRLEKLQERFEHEFGLCKDITLRTTRRGPTAADEVVLQAIERQVITLFASDDFGGDAGVILIAFHQAGRAFGRSDTALLAERFVLRRQGASLARPATVISFAKNSSKNS